MKEFTVFCTFLILFTISQNEVTAAKVVFVPMPFGNSPYFIFLRMAEEMASRSHEVSIITSKLLRKRETIIKHLDFKVNLTDEYFDDLMNSQISGSKAQSGMISVFPKMINAIVSLCESMLQDKDVIDELKNADLVITLSISPCAYYLAEFLNKPFIIVHVAGFSLTAGLAQVPLPPSYVPSISANDEMTFMQRTLNFLAVIAKSAMTNVLANYYFEPVLKKYKIYKGKSYADVFGNAQIHLVTADFSIEFAHPLMPNVFYVGSILPKPAKELSPELEEIMQQSGEHGVVVISFGSHISSLNEVVLSRIAEALGMLKQTVIWKVKLPPSVKPASNIRILDWLPQNDLLGHSKVKALVSHMGINGAYEAAYHGVPLVAACLMSDSFQNSIRFIHKAKMAKFIDVSSANVTMWKNTLEEVIYDPSYKMNAVRVSKLMRSARRTPVEQAADLMEYTLINGGRLPHLKANAYNLTWYQYLCLDVILFLMVSFALAIFVVIWLVKFVIRRLYNAITKQKVKKN